MSSSVCGVGLPFENESSSNGSTTRGTPAEHWGMRQRRYLDSDHDTVKAVHSNLTLKSTRADSPASQPIPLCWKLRVEKLVVHAQAGGRHVRHFLFLEPDSQGLHLTGGLVRGELRERHLRVERAFDHVLRQNHFGRSLGIVTDPESAATALIGGPRFAEDRCSRSRLEYGAGVSGRRRRGACGVGAR